MLLSEFIVIIAGLTALLLWLYREIHDKAESAEPVVDALPLLTNIPNFLCLKDANGYWLQANLRYVDIFNLGHIDWQGKTDAELSHCPGSNVETLRYSMRKDQEAWEARHAVRDKRVVHLPAGNPNELGFDITRTPIYDEHGQRSHLLITSSDVLPQKNTNSSVFDAVFYMNKIPFLLVDANFKITDINDAFAKFLGYSKQESVGNYVMFWGVQGQTTAYTSTLSAWFKKIR
jgi:hypothetical protein